MLNKIFAVLIAALVIISFSAAVAHEDDNNGCSNSRCQDGDDHDKGKGNDKDKDKDKDDDHGDDGDSGDGDGDEGDGDNGDDDGGDGNDGDTGGDGSNNLFSNNGLNWNYPSGGNFYFGNGDCGRILILEAQLKSNKYTNAQKLRAERMIINIAWEGYKTTPKQFYNKYCKQSTPATP